MAYYSLPDAGSATLLRDVKETIQITVYSDEAGADADGSVTVGVVGADGSTILAAGTATTHPGGGSPHNDGVYQVAIPAQANLNELTATWAGTWGSSSMTFTSLHGVVGGFYAVPAEVRGLDSISGETATFPAVDVVAAINYAESVIDDYCGASFVPRFRREVLSGTNSQTLKVSEMFPTKILSASIDGTSLTAGEIADVALLASGELVRKGATWTFTEPGLKVIVEYEHGANVQAPDDIRWAARTLARYHLLEQVSRIPDRAISVQSEFGNIQLAQPGMNRPTPLPDVNVILNRHRHRAPSLF